MNNIIQSLKIITLAIVLSFGLSYVYAWTAPTLPPPDGNVNAPINTSTTSQVKGAGGVGGLGIEGLIRGYSNAIFDGQVGIGTVSPNSSFQVHQGIDKNINFNLDTSSGTNESRISSTNDAYINPRPLWVAGSYLGFQTGLTGASTNEKMRILDNGNVGIGTTAPVKKLDVVGDIQASGDVCTTAGGGRCLSGSGPTDVYASKIIDGAAGGVFSTYCRITKSNGLVECKIANDWNMTSFGALITPFPATTPGSYSLSCQQGIAGAAWPACCRTNNTTGATECRRSNTWTLATPWVVVGSPF